jgi:glyoxylase-like metal-dependent hydrolase (beta-lactamase superfamily II)
MYGFSDHLKGIPRTAFSAERQGSSRYSIRPMHEIVEHVFARLTLPLPHPPKHVHTYVIEGDDGRILVDAGAGAPGAEDTFRGLEVERIVITHMHPDHVGGAAQAADATGAPVFQGALDYEQCERLWGGSGWFERYAEWFRRHGMPEAVLAAPIRAWAAASGHVGFVRDPFLLHEGDNVGGWTVIPLPGHADGQIGLLRDGVLIAADHLLAYTSPTVSFMPGRAPDPVGDYFASLERVIELDPSIAYPGHGAPIESPAERAAELIADHRTRLDRVASALAAKPRNAYEIAQIALRGDPRARHPMAVAETIAYLEHLVAADAAAGDGGDRVVTYTAR